MNRIITLFFSAAVVLVFLVSTAMIPARKPPENPVVTEAQALPAVGSLENLKTLLTKANSFSAYSSGRFKMTFSDGMYRAAAPTETKSIAGAVMEDARSHGSYSTTNVQVQGVDEADIVKTDGEYIYQVNHRRIIIARANLKKLREAEITGQYLSSRKIESALYLVANKDINYYWIMEQDTAPSLPAYRDTAGEGKHKFKSITYPDIRYFPDAAEPNYLLVAGLDLDRPEREMKVNTYLGAGQNIYASQQNLYVAVNKYPGSGTEIYKFALDEGHTDYKGKGEVPGTILNQFSMDEDNGSFRIATTKREPGIWSEGTSKNNVYILDDTLKVTGRLENIAPGEKIYSVRFMGDRAYMVTFKKVDPLFVIDLKNPKDPKILGALKIPGYSDYLHPYDENHIIGFGKDAEEAAPDGRPVRGGGMAFYQGMKIALFDVSDVTRPVEKFKTSIGDRGTDSELLRNHKALLFDRDRNLLAFPVTVMEVKDEQAADVTRYGEFAFQGAYVYNLDLVSGFKLKGKITHREFDDNMEKGYTMYNEDKNVERILYISDNLYTLSKSMIKTHDMNTLQEKKILRIDQ